MLMLRRICFFLCVCVSVDQKEKRGSGESQKGAEASKERSQGAAIREVEKVRDQHEKKPYLYCAFTGHRVCFGVNSRFAC